MRSETKKKVEKQVFNKGVKRKEKRKLIFCRAHEQVDVSSFYKGFTGRLHT